MKTAGLYFLPLMDSEALAEKCRMDLDIPRRFAAELGQSAVEAADNGYYMDGNGQKIEWGALVKQAIAAKISLPPDAPLPAGAEVTFERTEVQVANESSLFAGQRFLREGGAPLVLNFANGIHPGGGFLGGARAQEECLCRSSALYHTIKGDAMYEYHKTHSEPYASSDWAILSRKVPVFRLDNGFAIERPYLLDFLTCAAPYAPGVGLAKSAALLRERIRRILAIARAFGYQQLVLGAWGCGAFGNDGLQTAQDFRTALETEFCGAFSRIVFAISDWSPKRRFLKPFSDVFSAQNFTTP